MPWAQHGRSQTSRIRSRLAFHIRSVRSSFNPRNFFANAVTLGSSLSARRRAYALPSGHLVWITQGVSRSDRSRVNGQCPPLDRHTAAGFTPRSFAPRRVIVPALPFPFVLLLPFVFRSLLGFDSCPPLLLVCVSDLFAGFAASLAYQPFKRADPEVSLFPRSVENADM
jgi:hypothetical protein